MAETSLKSALEKIGLGALHTRFENQKIDKTMIGNLTDRELIQLGVETIGDRARLRLSTRVGIQQSTPTVPAGTDPSNETGSSSGKCTQKIT